MKKSKKVLIIVLVSLVLALGITYIVLYCLHPTQTLKVTKDTIDYICNKPLPIVGVSTLVLSIALYKIVVFIVKHKNSSVSELKEEVKVLKDDLEKSKAQSEFFSQYIEKLLKESFDQEHENIKSICNTIPNAKVKLLGEKLYGKKVDSEPKAEEI